MPNGGGGDSSKWSGLNWCGVCRLQPPGLRALVEAILDINSIKSRAEGRWIRRLYLLVMPGAVRTRDFFQGYGRDTASKYAAWEGLCEFCRFAWMDFSALVLLDAA